LNDWDGAEGLWRASKGTIVGETTADNRLEGHSYLIWRGGEAEDFEL